MFSVVSVCPEGGFHVTITHDALYLTMQGTTVQGPPPPAWSPSIRGYMDMFKFVYLGPHFTGTPSPPTSSNLLIMKHLQLDSWQLGSWYPTGMISCE